MKNKIYRAQCAVPVKENIKKACFFIINVIECKYKKVIKFKK